MNHIFFISTFHIYQICLIQHKKVQTKAEWTRNGHSHFYCPALPSHCLGPKGSLICLFHEDAFLQLLQLLHFQSAYCYAAEAIWKSFTWSCFLYCLYYNIVSNLLQGLIGWSWSCCIAFPAGVQVIKLSITRTLDVDSSISCSGTLSKMWLQVPELQHFHY